MRLLVTGDRNYRKAQVVYAALMDFLGENVDALGGVTVVHGDARGADTIADVCAQLIGYEVERHPADWDRHRRAAGPIRNKEMLDSGIDYWLAFHDNIDESKGTADMIERCRKAGIPGKLIGG